MSKVCLIAGVDGYIGWPLRSYLQARGWTVWGFDNHRRRSIESLVPLDRESFYAQQGASKLLPLDIRDTSKLTGLIRLARPSVIFHLAEEPSAPFSMMSLSSAIDTMRNNIEGTLSLIYAVAHTDPEIRIIKLGSMGEYIPSSWYHLSKVHDSNNLEFAVRSWGLNVVDVMQGPVYGVGGRFDYDYYYGTVINRFVAQAVAGEPLTVYGDGKQVRAFLPIQDSLQCLGILASVPAFAKGYTKINQFAEHISVIDLAKMVSDLTGATIRHIVPNPRAELASYPPDQTNDDLLSLGYQPDGHLVTNIARLVESVTPHAERINKEAFRPTTFWGQSAKDGRVWRI